MTWDIQRIIHGHAKMWNFSSSVQLNSSQVTAVNKWDVELNMRRITLYPKAIMYYFVYNKNTTDLQWQDLKLTLLMKENKRIDNPWIKIVNSIGAKDQDEKRCWIATKTTMGIILNIQNSQLLTLSSATEIFSCLGVIEKLLKPLLFSIISN